MDKLKFNKFKNQEMEKKRIKKQEKNEKKEDDDSLSIYDKFAIVGTIVLLIAFTVLLYIFYKIISITPDGDQLISTNKCISQLLNNANQADKDKSNIQDSKVIISSLENATISGSIYQTLVNYSVYELLLFSIQARSSICRESIHHEAVNQFSKLLTKMISLSGYKFQCNTEFIKGYLSLCYSQNTNFDPVFSLINAMTETTCSKEVYQSLIKASKQTNNFCLKFKITQFFNQHSNWNGVKFNNNEETEDLLCSLSENAIESLPQSLDNVVQKDFCSFVKNHRCDVFSEQSVVELCQNEVKDENL